VVRIIIGRGKIVRKSADFDIPIYFVIPALRFLPQYENLAVVQEASISDFGVMDYISEDIPESEPISFVPVVTKMIDGCKRAYANKDVMERGYVVLLHHDVVIEDSENFENLVRYVMDEGYTLAGQSESDGLGRNHHNGRFYLNACMIIIDPRKLGRWWEDRWCDGGWLKDGTIYQMRDIETYWKISHDALGNILYLNTEPGEFQVGRSCCIMFNGKPVVNHLWLSTVDMRVFKGAHTVWDFSAEEACSWRREWCEHYAKRFGVSLYECDDTIWSVDYYRRWSEGSAGAHGGERPQVVLEDEDS
jgi:hypothetical protein